MKIHHQEEMASLICQQWDLVACLESAALSPSERQALNLQLAKNVYHISYIVDIYQNPRLIFHYRGKSYDLYSDVVKDPRFELLQAETLLKQVFALHYATTIQVIEVGEYSKSDTGFIHAGLEYVHGKAMF